MGRHLPERIGRLLGGMLVVLAAAAAQRSATAADALQPLDLRQVKVGGEIGRRIDITVNKNLLALDVEKEFLAPYRAKKGLYTGIGKLIDATVSFAAYTKNETVIALKKRLVAEVIKSQEPDGYIGNMAPADRMWTLWDVHEMNYIIFGLTNDYRYFGQRDSLEAARKAADYILRQWSTMPANWEHREHVAAHVSVTGLERTLLALSRETGDRRYLDFCIRERSLPQWDSGIVIGRRDLIAGHVYAYFTRCLAQLELYRVQPEERLLGQSRRALDFTTNQDGATITGSIGQWEIWTDDQDGRQGLGETCATAYQLRVYDNLLRLEGNPRYGDLVERTVYNALFGAQSADGRRIRYFTPLESYREYWPVDAYCCPNNFRRIIAELPTMVYYRSKTGVAVNLYTPSEAAVNLDDGLSLKVRQETDYPTSGRVVIHLDPTRPATFPLQLRIPRWCAKATVAVNGKAWKKPIVPGEFLSVERQWAAGDQVTLDMPMTWRLVQGRKRQAGRAAVMRGPVVFCLNPTQNELLQKPVSTTPAATARLNPSWQESPPKPDAADLGVLVLDSASLKDLPDDTIRPGGMACVVKAETNGFATQVSGDLSLRLTEFPDPEGKVVYFRLPDPSVAVPDELFSGGSK